ncbi:hypothetical protein [Fibrella aquatilis]|uniref:Restriction endonuclease type IV Mrr domain-containing protein n=1 Tax=Fibrella aquatilis TaxID=2817059 RepID=A0A939G9H6_9BACT|nr:hypothetical protein [Fibrella aquatilis]MBO0932582.1 hypothetical protein [Fibrella aquatilis]
MLWRLHIKPDWSKGKTRDDVINYCITNKVAGIGWPVNIVPQSAQEYELAALAEYKSRCSAIAFAKKISIGHFIWTRDGHGNYYLGRVVGAWFYCNKEECNDLDIPNQIPCDWMEVGLDEKVPGKIVACFRSPRTLQSIEDEDKSMLQQSAWIFGSNTKDELLLHATRQELNAKDFFRLISSEDCEDVVGLYLQKMKGYCIIPSSCKKDTVGHEFILKHSETFELALVQVKQGKVPLSNKSLGKADHIFLFTTEGYASSESSNVTILSADELFSFVKQYERLLPEKIRYHFSINTQSLPHPATV